VPLVLRYINGLTRRSYEPFRNWLWYGIQFTHIVSLALFIIGMWIAVDGAWLANGADLKCPRAVLTGEVTNVRDGDTIEVGGLAVRLNGLAAPEGDEPGGTAATRAMRKMVEGRTLRCELDGERTRDRCVGVCYLDGGDIADTMVRQGLARDCPRFSAGRYR
jgi:micrococcal nuclease